MKVLIINNHFSPSGGAEVMAYNTYLALKKHGVEVYFWSSDKKPYFEPDYPYQKYYTKYTGGIFNLIKHPVQYYYNKEAVRDLNKFLSEVKIDLIHLNCFDIFSPQILKCCKNYPTVMTVHDVGLICPSYKLLYRQKTNCTKQLCKRGNYIQCLLNKCAKRQFLPSLIRTLYAYILLQNIKYIDKYITPSNALKELILKAEIGINTNDIEVINNFLSEKDYKCEPNYQNKGYFLNVGRFVKGKGTNYILEAMKDLPQDTEMHIIGDGPKRQEYENYAAVHNLHNIKFLGTMKRTELMQEYQNCIASILPSDCFESFGLANIESFINGKPVIASNIGGIPEIVEHNKNGLLFESENVEQLKQHILTYKNNPQLVVEHGKNGYEKAKTKYSEEEYFNQLKNVYQEVIKNGKRN